MFKDKISLIAPAHNEEECIEEFISRCHQTLSKNNLEGEILIINDASTDQTLNKIKNLQKKIKNLRVISHTKNKGLTSSVISGIENSTHEYIVFLPSDLESYPEEDIPKLINGLSQGYDMVVGSKNHKSRGFFKGISSTSFNFLVRLLFKVKVKDLGWIKAFKKEVYYGVEAMRSDWHRFFVVLAAAEGYKIKEVSVNFYPRKTGKSHYGKLGLKRVSGAFLDLFVIKFLTKFSKKPMHIFGSLGAAFMLFGFLIGLYLTYIGFFVTGSILDRTPLLLFATLLLITGIQLFAIGFLAELLVSISEKKKSGINN